MRFPIHRVLQSLLLLSALAARGAPANELEFTQRPPHEHGRVTLNISLENQLLTIELDAPAVNVVGFEHPPATPAEHAAVQRAARLLTLGQGLLTTPVEAGCAFEKAQLQEPRWEGGPPGASPAHEEHADYEATLSYRCAAPAKLTWLAPSLLDKLLNVVEARINLVSAAGQRSQTAGGGHVRVSLP